MKAKIFFVGGQNGIAYTGKNFQDFFNEEDFTMASSVSVQTRTLPSNMTEAQIVSTYGPATLTLGQMAWIFKNSSSVLKNGNLNLFFVPDVNSVTRMLGALWFQGAWYVIAEGTLDLEPISS